MPSPPHDNARKKIDWKSLKKPDSFPESHIDQVVSDSKTPVNWAALSDPFEVSQPIDSDQSAKGKQVSWNQLTVKRDTK